jgi:hypothetical protein
LFLAPEWRHSATSLLPAIAVITAAMTDLGACPQSPAARRTVRYTVRGVALHVIQHGELWPRDVHRRAHRRRLGDHLLDQQLCDV